MTLILVILHIVVCITLIMIVLLQTGKGADMGAAFGGGSSQTLFGSTGASTFLSKATTVAAVVFMLTSLALAYISSNKPGSSIVMDMKVPAKEQPAATDTAQPEVTEPVSTDTPAQTEEVTTSESAASENESIADSQPADEVVNTTEAVPTASDDVQSDVQSDTDNPEPAVQTVEPGQSENTQN